ncbi:MAG TPA: hypothetical protein VGC19_12145 [Rhodanobacter sp.]
MLDEDDPPDLDVYLFVGSRARPERVQQERRFQLDHTAAGGNHSGTGSHPGTDTGIHRYGTGFHSGTGIHRCRPGHGSDEPRHRSGAGQRFDRGALIGPEAISRLAAVMTYR